MIYEMNEIFIRRKHKMVRETFGIDIDIDNPIIQQTIATCLKNLESLGYTFSNRMINDVLRGYTLEEIVLFHNNMSSILTKLSGGNKVYTPMYPNFPKQIIEASYAELYINAILHYFGNAIGERIIPIYEKEYRSPLLEQTTLTVIDLGTIEEFHQMFFDIMSSKTSISEQDKQDLTDYIEFFAGHEIVKFPKTFSHKEVFAFVAKLAIERGVDENWIDHFKTATDVLRFATALSGGDVSLATNTKFISFSRSLRRYMLKVLFNLNKELVAEDMVRYSGKWVRLGERLHPGEFKSKYTEVFDIFSKIRNDEKIETFNSKLELLLQIEDAPKIIKLLKTRPGVFARKLDHVLRIQHKQYPNTIENIVHAFAEVAEQVVTPVLLQVANHFKYRDVRGSEYRIFFPKGSIAKMQVIPNDLPTFPYGICNSIDLICQQALWNRFNKLDKLGKVYVDPELEGYYVPFSQRSASSATRTIVRGSRIKLDENKSTIRFFMWWIDINAKAPLYNVSRNTVDLDLSSIYYDNNFQKTGHTSYTNLKGVATYHSGDLTSAPNGAAEFIDISLDSLPKNVRYIAMNVYSYSGQKFSEVECFAGWMEREAVNSGEIFEPKTVKQRFDMTAESRTMFPLIIDVKEREIIWCDLSVTSGTKRGGRNVESNVNTMTVLLNAIAKWKKPNLFDLFKLHGESRGELVNTPEEADFVFSVDENRLKEMIPEKGDAVIAGGLHRGPSLITVRTDITPLDIEKIMSEFL